MNFAFYINSIGFGVGLAMDACAVSMTNGLNEPKMKGGRVVFISLIYALFQMAMPLIGYFAGHMFVNTLAKFVPYITLVLLSYIGINTIIDSVKCCNEENACKTLTFNLILSQAIATSIDALSVGVTLLTYTLIQALVTAFIIGVTTFVLCVIAVYIGKKFGNSLGAKAKILGGVVLIIIGIEIFIKGVFF